MANKKITKFILALLIISMIMPATFFSAPQKTRAQGFEVVHDPVSYIPTWMSQAWEGMSAVSTSISAWFDAHKFAQWVLDNVLKRIAKALLAKMTQSIINCANCSFLFMLLF